MTEVELRDYQFRTLAGLYNAIRKGFKRNIVVVPGGGGKSTIFAKFCQVCVLRGKRVVFVVHKKELVEQFHLRLWEQFGVDSGIIMSGVKPKPWLPIQVCSTQTLVRRDCPDADVLIIDECHRAKSATYKKILSNYVGKIIVGLTATPFRGDGKGLGDIFENIVHHVRCKELIKKGHLVATKTYGSEKKVNLKGVKVKLGEYDQKELYKRYDSSGLYDAVVKNYERNAAGTKAIVFSINVEHSKNTCAAFVAAGYKAVHLDSDTSKALRREIIKKYRKNEYDILCNVSLFTEGFDVPFIETVILNRAIKSLVLFLQGVMRGMRPLLDANHKEVLLPDGTVRKKHCIVLDHGGNTIRHGVVEDYDDNMFTLSNDSHKTKGDALTKECPKCRNINYLAVKKCVNCGYEFKTKKVQVGNSGEYEIKLLEPDVIFIENLKGLPYSKAKKLPIWKVRAYEALKGYKNGWYQIMVKEMKPDLKKAKWAEILSMCIQAEKQKNTYEVTMKLIKMRKERNGSAAVQKSEHSKFGW